MKKALVIFTVIISFATRFAFGDVKIVNEVKNIINGKDQESGENISYYKADRARMEAPGGAISIIRLDKAVMWIINDAEKTYMEMNAEQLGALASIMGEIKEPGVEKTGETKKIGKYNCTKIIVKMEIMGSKTETEIWGTKDIKPDPTLLKFNDKMLEIFKGNPSMESSYKMMQKVYDMEFFPVQTTTRAKIMGFSSENSSLLKEISTEKLDNSLFEIPEGYEKQEMPNMGNMSDTGTEGVIKGKSKNVIKGKTK